MAIGDKKNGKGRGEIVAALDVGTSKTACFVAHVEDDGKPTVIGVGHQPSKGLRGGAVIDIELARETIADAVNAAERMASQTVRRVFVSLGCGRPKTERLSFATELHGREIGSSEMRHLIEQSRQGVLLPDRELLQALPLGFRVDGQRGVRDPRGMFGQTLTLDINTVTAEAGPARTLSTCVRGGHLEIAGLVVAPYAAALACLVEDEMAMGTAVIDMGGGTTSLAAFEGHALVHAVAIAIGGAHVTHDIAHGLSTPLAQAERIKIMYGCAVPRPGDDREIIDVPQIGAQDSGEANHMPKSLLSGIIKPRIEETLELVRGKLAQSGLAKAATRRVVLTGGASQLSGVAELASSILDRSVRCGRPRRLRGLAEAAAGPAFATAAGLVVYANERHETGGLTALAALAPTRKARLGFSARSRNPPSANHEMQATRPTAMRRLGTWLHDHF